MRQVFCVGTQIIILLHPLVNGVQVKILTQEVHFVYGGIVANVGTEKYVLTYMTGSEKCS
jgi:hypothetical protein